MNIRAKITGIKYLPMLVEELDEIDIKDFCVNEAPSSFALIDKRTKLAISKWVSPKRTRSYPYERVYNTLCCSKKITIIPIVKDEGAIGDRDFLQWDTVSLMSLLDVFVIFAYYVKADKKGNKITNQKFDNGYILSKIKEIEQYHSSALHWNLNELKNNFTSLIDKTIKSYSKIENDTGVKLHGVEGIEKFKSKIGNDVIEFMKFSREKAAKAQDREIKVLQPKESLNTLTKAKITITNYLGGEYFFTVDEVALVKSNLFLIEDKHSSGSILPSKSDIKDGLLKMILYSNLCETYVNDKKVDCKAVLRLTSTKIKGKITSENNLKQVRSFCENNKFTKSQIETIVTIFNEANKNNFMIEVTVAK